MRVPSDGTEGTPGRSQTAVPTSSASSTGSLSSFDAMARASGAEKARRRPQVGILEALLALLVLVLALTRGRPAATLLRQVPHNAPCTLCTSLTAASARYVYTSQHAAKHCRSSLPA